MRLLAGLASAITIYLGLGIAFGVRPTASPGVGWWATGTARVRFGTDRFIAGLAQADVALRPGQFVAVALCLGVAGAGFGLVATGVTALGLLTGAAGLVSPGVLVDRRRRRLLAERQAAWPDAVRDISTHLRAGASLHAALCQLAHTGPNPLRAPFNRYRLLANAIDQRVGLETMRAELASPLSDRILEILMVGLDQGAPVVLDVLDDLATSTTEDIRLVEEIQTAQMETRLEARGAAALPFLVLALLCATSADYRAFYQSPLGWVVICIGALLAFLGLFAIGRLGAVPSEERVLIGATR